METTKKKTGLYWFLFFISVIVFAVMLYFPASASYCSMILPFNTTFFAKALDLL